MFQEVRGTCCYERALLFSDKIFILLLPSFSTNFDGFVLYYLNVDGNVACLRDTQTIKHRSSCIKRPTLKFSAILS